MFRRRSIWIVILVTLIALYFNLPKFGDSLTIPRIPVNFASYIGNFPIRLGLDLQGGSQLVLEADVSKIDEAQKDTALDSAREILERRVNLYGVSEAVVQTSRLGEQRRILVDLPGIKDASAAADLVGRTAQLEFRQEPASYSAEATQAGLLKVFYFEPTGITGADLKSAQVVFNQSQNVNTSPQVEIQFTPEGAKKFADVTRRNVNKPLAIFLDDQPLSLNPPIVQQEIVGGSGVISGGFTAEEAKNLAVQLNAGALPVPIHILEQRSIGASLGQASVDKSLVAGVIGLIVVMIFMVALYGWYGVIADIALVIYTLISLAIFRTGLFILPPVTLTLAGIAGFILSIGMAVDANILIFERMKEERRRGNSRLTSLDLGFKRAWSSIRDSNISSLMTAGVLYFMGTGLIRGFALTLAIGVLVSMFTAFTVTRTFLRVFLRK